MKKLIVSIAVLCICSITYAQNDSTRHKEIRRYNSQSNEIKTLFSKSRKLGGYGAFSFGYAPIGNSDAMIAGGRAGLIIGQHLTLGVAGRGFATDFDWNDSKDGDRSFYHNGGYGGFLLEPIILPRSPIHLSFPVIFGMGGVGYYWREYDVVQEYWRDGYSYSGLFLVVEPAAELEFNITKFMRMSLGASYRLTSDVDISGMDRDGLTGWSTYLAFKFGRF